MQKKRQSITVRVTESEKNTARALARQEYRSVSGYLRQLLRLEIRRQGGGAPEISAPRSEGR